MLNMSMSKQNTVLVFLPSILFNKAANTMGGIGVFEFVDDKLFPAYI